MTTPACRIVVAKLAVICVILGSYATTVTYTQADCGAGCPPGETCFSGFGTLVQGDECVLFQAEEGGLYILGHLAPFEVGDRVFVSGCIDPGCINTCLQGNGCILDNTIALCAPDQTWFSGCGEVILGPQCIGFQADAGELYVLDQVSPFGVGQRVSVTGCIDPDCFSFCTQGDCIIDNAIATCNDPLGTAARYIVEDPGWPAEDRIEGGADRLETFGFRLTASPGSAIGRGTILGAGLEAGAKAASSRSSSNAARAVAFRTYVNEGNDPVQFEVRATLRGEFLPSSATPDLQLSVTGGIYLLDNAGFQDAVAASGLGPEQFLLQGDSLTAAQGGEGRVALDVLFPVAASLGRATVLDANGPGGVPLSYPLHTDVISIGAGQTFVLIFDVSAFARGGGDAGETDFLGSLEPDPVLFADPEGEPVVAIVPLDAGVPIGEANVLHWRADPETTLSWISASGASLSRIYRGGVAELPALLDATPDACLRLESGAASAEAVLTEDPMLEPGRLYWYLVTGADAIDEGTPGVGAVGERVLDPSGACP